MISIWFFLFLTLVLYFFKSRRRSPNEPPLVPGRWLFGNALEFSRDAVSYLLKKQRDHGDVFTLKVLNQYLTIIMDPHFYEEIGKHKNLSFEEIHRQVNTNVFGFEVRDTKTLFKETGISIKGRHQTSAMKSFIDNLERSIQDLKSLNTRRNAMKLRPVVVSTIFFAIFNSIFGTSKDDNFNPGIVHKNFEIFHKYFNFLWLGMPLWWFPEACGALKNLQNMPSAHSLLGRKDLSCYLRRAIKHLLDEKQTESGIIGHNLVYLHVNYNTFRLSYWAIYFLLKNKKAKISIMEDVNKILESFENDDITLSEDLINRMQHLESFVQETCRISSGVFIIRHVSKTFTIQLGDGRNFLLRAGDKVAIFPPSIHKNPEIFNEPQEFKHDRFLGRKFYSRGREIATPIMSFGTLCPGKKHALLQVKIFIIVMLLHFEMSLDEEGEVHFDDKFCGHEVLPPKGDAHVHMSPKNFHRKIKFSDSL